ncbi:MAG: prenyltransferase/squalene oxidase repeat-containing protein [Planctomycetota bacterium]
MASTQSHELPDPEAFAGLMRQRAEDALSASVHHASLSQQYLSLAQKFTGLAEQSAFGPGGMFDYAERLDREAATGIPATACFPQRRHVSVAANPETRERPVPALADQAASPTTASTTTVTADAGGPERSEEPRTDVRFDDVKSSPAAASESLSAIPDNAEGSSDGRLQERIPPDTRPRLHSPPARTSLKALHESAQEAEQQVAEDSAPHRAEPAQTAADGTAIESSEPTDKPPAGVAATATRRTRPARRPRISIRRLLERARLAAMEQTDRVRLRVRQKDLQPKLRKTSEEVVQELKRSRRPATISTLVTLVVLGILALGRLELAEEEQLPPLSASFSGPSEEAEEAAIIEQILEQAGEQQERPAEADEAVAESEPPMPEPTPERLPEPLSPVPELPLPEPELQLADIELPETPIPESPVGTQPVKSTRNATPTAAKTPAYQHRTDAGKKQMLAKYGGSAGSESAVALALEWLAKRQRADGSWDFADVGPCTSPGRIRNPIGGTAYALLPFLAAGQTHRQGNYRRQIQAGLQYLTTVGISVPAGYDLRGVVNQRDDDPEPNYAYYVHGAATLALCEAWGMSRDRTLKPACEGAVRFLVHSQDPRGGGWRYNPQQPGSTSCTAIQVMALKAAERAGIAVPKPAWQGVSFYLDSVAVDREGRYGYESQKKAFDISVTSMALLSRMYSGWKRDDGDLRKGIALIDRKGPYDNLYYCYFASQVMKNWGGPEWQRWNERLRDDLVAWQEREGDSAGSWAPRDRSDTSVSGGRLLTTCLAALTLEVYYRNQSVFEDEEPSETTGDGKTAVADGAGSLTTEGGIGKPEIEASETKRAGGKSAGGDR